MLAHARDLAWIGKNQSEIAFRLGVPDSTFSLWLKRKPELREAVSSYELAHAPVVRKLYERALGYTHPETKAQWVTEYQIAVVDDPETGELVEKAVKVGRWEYAQMDKHYPPDTAAALAILTNRQPDQWKQKTEGVLDVNLTVRRALMELATD